MICQHLLPPYHDLVTILYATYSIFGCQIELWSSNVQTQLSRIVLLKHHMRLHGLRSDALIVPNIGFRSLSSTLVEATSFAY
jgi:hypothetical protein